jgi:hypothetical protein
MGMERRIRFPTGATPGWSEIAGQLTAFGETPVVRMIDSLPAFPDEVPPPEWQELRVALSGGMVTLRRQSAELICVCWGSADPSLVRSWKALCRAAAQAGSGVIVEPGGRQVSAADFASETGMPG